MALHLQIALWLRNPRYACGGAGVRFLAGSDYNQPRLSALPALWSRHPALAKSFPSCLALLVKSKGGGDT